MAAMRECLNFFNDFVRASMPTGLVATDGADRSLFYKAPTRSDASAGEKRSGLRMAMSAAA
jgi:hypothetical protein